MNKAGKYAITAILAVICLLSSACGDSGKNVLGDVGFAKDTIGVNDAATLSIAVRNSAGQTQVSDTNTVKVSIIAETGNFSIAPVPENAVTIIDPGALEEILRPGAVMPRQYHVKITPQKAAAGVYSFKVTLTGDAGDEVQEVKLTLTE